MKELFMRGVAGVSGGGGGSPEAPEAPEWGIKGSTWQRRYPVNDP